MIVLRGYGSKFIITRGYGSFIKLAIKLAVVIVRDAVKKTVRQIPWVRR